ncbi:TIGR03826 family flagellar region protein [Neobacillus muris]|uniref:TIGR03826 family flagellar region protein n=1 Tax=Neobacillus muris TaxID=2941334 RepID=UPI00203B626C|nr:TIGR03826 family flagellar region protein [Neobacillus muris]
MASPKMGNCPRCKKLYLKIRDICEECYQKQETEFQAVSGYLREHKGSTLQEVSEATEVSIAQIRQFILSGRIMLVQFPNLTYPCEICGTEIRKGRTCSSCTETAKQLADNLNKTVDEKKSYLRVMSERI